MDIEQLRSICLDLPGVTEDVKWENHLCFLVANKMFLIAGLDISPTTASFKVPPEQFNDVASKDGFKQAPYLAKGQWVHTSDVELLTEEEWVYYSRQSYELIKSKLPKKVQRELEGMQ
ncbi:MAG: MmcQ/YjbR family DNA-binding protein [Flavobacteriales bacterium]|nr:MmcQ/YjbR family DNA-binding protein [Flavobacteriales bacterium]